MTGMTCRKMATTSRSSLRTNLVPRPAPLSPIRYASKNLNACLRGRLFYLLPLIPFHTSFRVDCRVRRATVETLG